MYKRIEKIIEEMEQKIIGYRRDFHKYPEVGWTEFRTASLIGRKLMNLGYHVKLGREVIDENSRMGVPSEEELNKNYIRAIKQGADQELVKMLKGGFTGVLGTFGNGKGPTVALRFDMDALNIEESKDQRHLPQKEGFSSVNKNIMHGCGHDGHIAIGLGVAEVLMNIKDQIKGTVKLVFQPAEEGVRGAKSMVESGILDDVDYILSGHIGLRANKSGQLFCRVGDFLATTKLDVLFTGKSSHAANAPEEGNNALLSAATAVLNLNSIPRHSRGITRINVGKLVSGTNSNIIPQSANMIIETRGETSEINQYMVNYGKDILKGSTLMHHTKLNINVIGETLGGESDDELVEMAEDIAHYIPDFKWIYNEKLNFGASEDFTYMMNKVQENDGKALYILIGSNIKAFHHNSKFDFSERDLKNGVKIFSIMTLKLMNKY